MKEFTNNQQSIPYAPKNLTIKAPYGYEFKTQDGRPEFRLPLPGEYYLYDNTSVFNTEEVMPKTARLILNKLPPPKIEQPALPVDKKPTVAFKYIETRYKLTKDEWYRDGNHGFVKLNQDWDFAPFSPREVYERIEL